MKKEDFLISGKKLVVKKTKKVAKQTVFAAKKKAEIEKLKNVENDDVTVFRIAKQMRKENKDIVGEKCIRHNSGKLGYSDEEKEEAWKQHYERPPNVEFPWSEEDLPVTDPVLGPPTLVTREVVEKSITKMKKGKAPCPSGVVTDMLKASLDICITNSIIRNNTMPNEWNYSTIISLYKGKGEDLDRGNYWGLKLTEHILKVIVRIIKDFIRNIVKIDDMQFGFMPGRGTINATFIVRQIQEAYIRKNRNLYLNLCFR